MNKIQIAGLVMLSTAALTSNAEESQATEARQPEVDTCINCTGSERDLIKIDQANALATRLLTLYENLQGLSAYQASIQQLSEIQGDAVTNDIASLLNSLESTKRVAQTARSSGGIEQPQQPQPKSVGLDGLIAGYADLGGVGRSPLAAVISHGRIVSLTSSDDGFTHNGLRYFFAGVRRSNNQSGETEFVIALRQGSNTVELPWSR